MNIKICLRFAFKAKQTKENNSWRVILIRKSVFSGMFESTE